MSVMGENIPVKIDTREAAHLFAEDVVDVLFEINRAKAMVEENDAQVDYEAYFNELWEKRRLYLDAVGRSENPYKR
jgi:hypothetical protein